MKPSTLDIYKVIAHIKVFGLNLYGSMYNNEETGRNNLQDYFLPRGWTKARLKRVLTFLVREGVLYKESSNVVIGYNRRAFSYKYSALYKLSFFYKSSLKLIDV